VILARSLRILLAVLLLSAQHAALSHAISHLDKHGLPAEEQSLCEQHDALGTVAGALGGAAAPLIAIEFPFLAVFVSDLPAVSRPGLAPSSRGPPTFL
jgi:hypothetical protein